MSAFQTDQVKSALDFDAEQRDARDDYDTHYGPYGR